MHSSKTNPQYPSHTTVLHNLVQFNIGCITNSKKLFVFLNPLTQRLSVMGTTMGADISAHFSLFTQPFYEIIIIQECINMDCCLRVEILVLNDKSRLSLQGAEPAVWLRRAAPRIGAAAGLVADSPVICLVCWIPAKVTAQQPSLPLLPLVVYEYSQGEHHSRAMIS